MCCIEYTLPSAQRLRCSTYTLIFAEVYSLLHYVIKFSVTYGRSVVFSGDSAFLCHDITEILLKVVLKHHNPFISQI